MVREADADLRDERVLEADMIFAIYVHAIMNEKWPDISEQ
jgi:hypothetical protein